MSKNFDPVKGKEIIDHLINENLMLPMTENAFSRSREEKLDIISEHVRGILETLGYDLTDEELVDTPMRVAKVYVDDWFYAWDPEKFPKCTTFDNKGLSFDEEIVIVKDIRTTSNCAHHLTITDLVVDVGYIPRDKMIGISKINHIVSSWLSKNPTSQETLTKAIATALSKIMETPDVIVRITGVHYCVVSRSAKDRNSKTVTAAALGKFGEQHSDIRKEFMSQIL